jgi:urease accessory protein UreH
MHRSIPISWDGVYIGRHHLYGSTYSISQMELAREVYENTVCCWFCSQKVRIRHGHISKLFSMSSYTYFRQVLSTPQIIHKLN